MTQDTPTICDVKIVPDHVKIDLEEKGGTFMLKSETTKGLAFKIKTTRPREYVVEPSMGKLPPFNEINISVKLTNESTILTDISKKEFKPSKNQTNGDEFFLTPSDHRFKVEIYTFDWRQTEDELKAFLKKKDISSYEKKLDVYVVKNEKSGSVTKNQILNVAGYIFIGVQFLRLVKVMLF